MERIRGDGKRSSGVMSVGFRFNFQSKWCDLQQVQVQASTSAGSPLVLYG